MPVNVGEQIIPIVRTIIAVISGILFIGMFLRGPIPRLGRLGNAICIGILAVICMAGGIPWNNSNPENPWNNGAYTSSFLLGSFVFFVVSVYILYSPNRWPAHFPKLHRKSEITTQARPPAVIRASKIFRLNAVAFLVGAVIFLVSSFFPPNLNPITMGILSLLLLCIAAIYEVLGYGFYNLRPWAYTPVRYLVRIDRLSVGAGLSKEVEQPEVWKAFGLDESPGAE